MVREAKGRVQLHVRHVATDAVSGLSCIGVGGPAVVAPMALLVIKSRLVPHRILVCRMAGGAGELSRAEAAAFHQPQRLKAYVFELRVVYRRLDPVAVAAEANLLRSGHFSGIRRMVGDVAEVLIGAQMAALALNAGNHRFQFPRDRGGMAADARLQIARRLHPSERRRGIRRASGGLADGDSVLM